VDFIFSLLGPVVPMVQEEKSKTCKCGTVKKLAFKNVKLQNDPMRR